MSDEPIEQPDPIKLTTQSGPGFPLPVAPGGIQNSYTSPPGLTDDGKQAFNAYRTYSVNAVTAGTEIILPVSGKALLLQMNTVGTGIWLLYLDDNPEPIQFDCGYIDSQFGSFGVSKRLFIGPLTFHKIRCRLQVQSGSLTGFFLTAFTNSVGVAFG